MEKHIILDYMTPKRVHFFKSLDYLLQNAGYKIIRIARDYGETINLLENKGLNYDLILQWGKDSLESKLKVYADNINVILDYINKNNLNIKAFITLMDPSISRVAYGLSKPLINFSDLPDAIIPGKLSLTLSDYIYIPFCISERYISENYCISKEKIYKYPFLDPVLWLKDYIPSKKEELFSSLNIPEKYLNKKLIYARLEPLNANYYMSINHKKSLILELIENILKEYNDDIFIIIHPRYKEKLQLYQNIENIKIINENLVDSISIAANADLFIGGGGTINIEAIYFGTPVISVKPVLTLYEKYLVENGLSYRASNIYNKTESFKLIKKILENNIRLHNKDISKLWEGNLNESIKKFEEDFLAFIEKL
ncbi:hypothetical protein LN42_05680 [Marinitoga sp. 1137]|uniref:DUF354 domain-containing protein n=1 Tax=Marinitoga sp. 1137 TaxID=1545835 RepID=UPI000950ADE1|nr:DUF354 domain-containing protein [Marinitoga sp. 1137]APT75925.1 hypothetical protein LN42_05680 [Marinitoga sp. 1137]